MKSGNINFLEPSGPLQACNGTALLFIILYIPIMRGLWITYSNYTLFIFHATLNLNYDGLRVLILRAEFYVLLSVK